MRVALGFALVTLSATSVGAVPLSGALRVRVVSASSPFVQAGEVQAFDLGGTNVALAANGGQAFAPTQFGANARGNAIDGELASYYQSTGTGYIAGGSTIDYLDITFGLPSDLASLTIYGTETDADRDLYDVSIYNGSNDVLYRGQVDSRNGSGSIEFGLTGDGTGGGVPEPASWTLLIAGFGLVGTAARRRNIVAV